MTTVSKKKNSESLFECAAHGSQVRTPHPDMGGAPSYVEHSNNSPDPQKHPIGCNSDGMMGLQRNLKGHFEKKSLTR